MQSKNKKILAYVLNFIVVGSGFVFYDKFLVGLLWLAIFALANLSELFWGMNVSLILRSIVMFASFIHLNKIIRKIE